MFRIFLYIIFLLLTVIFHKRILLTLFRKQRNACWDDWQCCFRRVRRACDDPLSELLFSLYLSVFFYIASQSSRTVTILNFSASSSRICDELSFNNPCKSSAFNFRDVPEHDRLRTSKSLALNCRNQYANIVRYTSSSKTEQIDSHALATFFPCWNKGNVKRCQLFKNAKKRKFIWSLNNYTRALKKTKTFALT